jgi:type II secretory pathway component PulK
MDFAKLFNSSLVDTETLAKPTIASDDRKESALKYIGLWGSNKVNINSAPRQVLEAAFVFGGDAQEIAQEIIERRRIEPFEDVNDLKRSLFRYSDSIEKCKDFVVAHSDFFTIRVTAVSGVARASAVVAIRRTENQYQKIAVFAG